MFSLDALSKKVAAYRSRQIVLDEFEEWFRGSSWGWYDKAGEPLSDVIAAVEIAISSYESGELTEDELRKELAAAIAPFPRIWRVSPAPQFADSQSTAAVEPVEIPFQGGISLPTETGTLARDMDRRPLERTTHATGSLRLLAAQQA